ncbi:MAG TPA: hypothetical protein VF655_01885 [Allosphingosinicella sp.]|jgi:hypothetical protein
MTDNNTDESGIVYVEGDTLDYTIRKAHAAVAAQSQAGPDQIVTIEVVSSGYYNLGLAGGGRFKVGARQVR